MSQVKYVFKISMDKGVLGEMIVGFFKNVGDMHWQSLVLSLICMSFLFGLKMWKKHPNWKYSKQSKFIPGPLIILVLATIYTWSTDNTDNFKVLYYIFCVFFVTFFF